MQVNFRTTSFHRILRMNQTTNKVDILEKAKTMAGKLRELMPSIQIDPLSSPKATELLTRISPLFHLESEEIQKLLVDIIIDQRELNITKFQPQFESKEALDFVAALAKELNYNVQQAA